mgnify:CR=1 FL=1
MDIIGMLQDGSGALAWITAVLLALGGTAVVVAVWSQIREGVPPATVLRAALGLKPQKVAPPEMAPASSSETAIRPQAEPTHHAVRAYRNESTLTAASAEDPAPASESVLTERQLTVYLNRLRQAADTLEEVAQQAKPAKDQERTEHLIATH